MKHIADARAFMLGHAAIDHIIKERLTGVDLYCVFRNTAFNTAIPLMAYQRLDASARDQPKVSEASPVSIAPSSSPTPAKPFNVRVLLVEDNPDDVHMLKTALRTELACDVVVTFTRQVFEMELERMRPDLIVSDSNVRTFDGIVALKLARKKYPDVPFIFCSGSSSPEKRETALALGATAWTSKENCFQQLVQVILRIRDRKG